MKYSGVAKQNYFYFSFQRLDNYLIVVISSNDFYFPSQITCYRVIPLRAMSRAWGWLSSQHVPLSLRCWLYTRYANMYGVNLEEAAYSLEQYNSLCEFFIRPLKEGTRPVAEYEPLVSALFRVPQPN